jgi:leukotriene-A4 hydrolase
LPYAKKYAAHYWGQSITTDEWKGHLYDYFKEDNEALEALRAVNWDVSAPVYNDAI